MTRSPRTTPRWRTSSGLTPGGVCVLLALAGIAWMGSTALVTLYHLVLHNRGALP